MVHSPLDLIGNTPLVELGSFRCGGLRFYAKLEGQNPSGSIKDRVALRLVDNAVHRGDIEPGATLVEASSGNMAIALAMIARQRGFELLVVLPERVPQPIIDIIELLGARIERCANRAGMRGAIERAREIAERQGFYALQQFHDPANVEVHYETTGEEIFNQLPQVDLFVAGIGTGGTVMGVGRRLRERNPHVKVIGVEPKMGERLQGLSTLDDAWEVPLLDLDALDRRFLVDASRSIELARAICRREGLIVGVSAGAALHAALRVTAEPDMRANIVVMFSDGGWKYLPTRPWQAARHHDEELNDVHWW